MSDTTKKRPTALVISFSDLSSDGRVRRQIDLIRQRCEVTAVGLSDPDMSGVSYIHAGPDPRNLRWQLRTLFWLGLRQNERYYWTQPTVKAALTSIGARRFDYVIANDPSALPLATRVAKGSPLLYDSHEYAPAKQEDDLRWRLIMKPYYVSILKRYLSLATRAITVSQGLAKAYRENFGVSMEVIMNAPHRQDLNPSLMQNDKIRLVHHGNAVRRRKLGMLIELMELLDNRFTLDFILKPSERNYYDELVRKAAGNPRIAFRDPVPPERIAETINDYDIGVYSLPPANFNMANALPNKLFEFIQARLALAIGPTPEMANVVKQFDCGVVAEDFSVESLATKLNELDRQDIERFKRNACQAADSLNYENVSKKLDAVFSSLAANPKE